MTHNPNNSKEIEKKVSFQGTGLTTSERRWGKKQFNEYKKKYHIETPSDLQLLEELVFREALQERYKRKIGKLAKDVNKKNKESGKKEIQTEIVPKFLLNSLNQNLEQILILREKLGLFEEKKGKDPFKYIQILRKKFTKWREENQGSRTLVCPHCSKMIMLKIKTEAWEALKHPFFKDRVLANEYLWELYKEGKITKEDIAKVLHVPTDYIDWLEEKIFRSK